MCCINTMIHKSTTQSVWYHPKAGWGCIITHINCINKFSQSLCYRFVYQNVVMNPIQIYQIACLCGERSNHPLLYTICTIDIWYCLTSNISSFCLLNVYSCMILLVSKYCSWIKVSIRLFHSNITPSHHIYILDTFMKSSCPQVQTIIIR